MRYATWNVVFDKNDVGSVPKNFKGFFYNSETQVIGSIPENADLSKFSTWSPIEISAEEMLELAQERNPLAYLLEDGNLAFPIEA